MQKDNCFLCTNLADRGGRLALGHGLALTSDIAPLTLGHILLHTDIHVNSFASISQPMLRRWRDKILSLLDQPPLAGRDLLFFEHGTDGNGQVAAGCTDHAHIHVLPLSGEEKLISCAEQVIERLGPELTGPTLHFEELGNLKGKNYFWIADKNLFLRLVTPTNPERQYLRRIVAEAIGRQDHQTWDTFDEQQARATMDAWKGAIVQTGVED